ncbi:hypothetical protein ACOMHN_066859 [Nucella lapillus]
MVCHECIEAHFHLKSRRQNKDPTLQSRYYYYYYYYYYCYGMESIPLTPTLSRSIDSPYRRMLRSSLGIFYPDRISNDELFAKTQLPPLSRTLRRRRLRRVGHQLCIGLLGSIISYCHI